jgi:hypothetical protein
MTPIALFRLIYRSTVAIPGPPDRVEQEIARIVDTSRRRNAETGLTGALLRSGPAFIQVLEGPLAGLEATYDRISGDLRHTEFELIEFVPAPERCFASWDLAFVAEDPVERWRHATPGAEAADPALGGIAALIRRLIANGARGPHAAEVAPAPVAG